LQKVRINIIKQVAKGQNNRPSEITFNQCINYKHCKKDKQRKMKFFKEIGLIIFFSNGRFVCWERFEFGIPGFQVLIENGTILCEFVYILHAKSFIKCCIPAELYGIEKRIGKKQGY